MKATEQYFPVVLSIMLYKVVLTFEFEGQVCFSIFCKMKSVISLNFGRFVSKKVEMNHSLSLPHLRK